MNRNETKLKDDSQYYVEALFYFDDSSELAQKQHLDRISLITSNRVDPLSVHCLL
jgi:hypothetical protein